jgi:hypothetical protein
MGETTFQNVAIKFKSTELHVFMGYSDVKYTTRGHDSVNEHMHILFWDHD